MKNMRIILIAVLTIAISNMVLSYFRLKLQAGHIVKSKCFEHSITISPSGLTDELDNNPACVQKSKLTTDSKMLNNNDGFHHTGAIFSDIYIDYYSIITVQSKTSPGTLEVYDRDDKTLLGYWGANGFSSDDITKAGQFSNDITISDFFNSRYLYDRQANSLYKLEFKRNDKGSYDLTGYAGLDIPDGLDIYQIASTHITAMPSVMYNFVYSNSSLIPASKYASEDENKNIDNLRGRSLGVLDGETLVGIDSATTVYRHWGPGFFNNPVHLVDRSGDIYLGNFDTGKVEKLPFGDRSDIETLCRDNYSYSFCPIYKVVYDRPKTGDKQIDADIKIASEEIIGYAESRLSRIGDLYVNVYDTKGKKLASASESGIGRYFDEETANLRNIRNLIENLPGILSVTMSYLTRDWFKPIETWQTLFLMPSSVANYATLTSGSDTAILAYWENASLSVVITIALLVWYAFNVKKYGLSNRQRKFWQYLIILFGPAAFLAYMIAKPKIVQVTCGNCGKLRQPDQDNCHHCRADWDMPQLNAVDWQIK